ncbi:hypothetical protein [Desulfobacula sp.]|uniref:hypothetical protein n=1 Tax=Desulfobacula sp. TaxID=2593537 RepID=UPI002619364A|nr:hypothetical protein [Desulfobacula sp.]
MSDPNVPNIPASTSTDQVAFFTAVKSLLETLSGQGRNTDEQKALRVSDLEKLGINLNQFKNSSSTKPYAVITSSSGSLETPNPPRSLTVTKGPFVHTLTWTNPIDTIVSHIEVWVAESSQERDDAVLLGIVTMTSTTRGEAGVFKHSGFTVTHDFTYWIRAVSYTGKNSIWAPPDAQGGYVVTGDESVGETIDGIIDMLSGTTPDLYDAGHSYVLNELCRTSDGRRWKSISVAAHSGNEPPNTTYWERAGILMQGDVDDIPTVGIDGNLVVDKTILARHIQADSINADHIDTSEVFIGLSVQSSNFISGVQGWKIDAAAQTAEFNSVVMSFNDLQNKPDSLGDINIDELRDLNDSAENIVFSDDTERTLDASTTFAQAEEIAFSSDFEGGAMVYIEINDDYAGELDFALNDDILTNEIFGDVDLQDTDFHMDFAEEDKDYEI